MTTSIAGQTESLDFIVVGQALSIQLETSTNLSTGAPTFRVDLIKPGGSTIVPITTVALTGGSTTSVTAAIAAGVLDAPGRWQAQVVTPASGSNAWMGVPHIFTVSNRLGG